MRRLVEYVEDDWRLKHEIDDYDIENNVEHVTPYMLAILCSEFEIATLLIETKKVNKYYINKNRKHVY
jgi:hypothetical protein